MPLLSLLLLLYSSNSSSCLFHAIWLAGENVLHFDKSPWAGTLELLMSKNKVLVTKLEL